MREGVDKITMKDVYDLMVACIYKECICARLDGASVTGAAYVLRTA